jgi:S-adenosylmethionine:tRNA-ribosyltransferase-isomerase (queuine synthetase)
VQTNCRLPAVIPFSATTAHSHFHEVQRRKQASPWTHFHVHALRFVNMDEKRGNRIIAINLQSISLADSRYRKSTIGDFANQSDIAIQPFIR